MKLPGMQLIKQAESKGNEVEVPVAENLGLLAFVFWLIFSLLFSLYASIAGSYNETYGSLAGVTILMLYVYYSALIMLVGAEMNQVIEWYIPDGKNEGEKIPEDDRKPGVHRLNSEAGQDGEGR